ncbi:hypothetical protein VNI00_013719 [Paramarasmius palmivorus]|uniref:Uncharacterized protein n=1 Tax=Paramarasmius palmivorus TaxID=297713 RepID=A0AAW0BW40_9AGAR
MSSLNSRGAWVKSADADSINTTGRLFSGSSRRGDVVVHVERHELSDIPAGRTQFDIKEASSEWTDETSGGKRGFGVQAV